MINPKTRIVVNKTEKEKAFDVVGITIRTTNKEAIENSTIQKLWQKFFNEQILSKIPNKIDNFIIALYHNYENDKNGAYNLLLGARVSSIDKIPEGMVARHVPASKRAIFISEPIQKETAVFNLWKKIWDEEDQGRLNRAYGFDYELYDLPNNKLLNDRMEIHIDVK